METLHVAEGQAFNVLGARIPNWSGWLASIVLDEFGNHVGPDGTSQSISNDLDLQLLLTLRSKCSVIVTTGATARAEKYKSSRFAPIAFITRNRNSLHDVPAIRSPGVNQNIFLESSSNNLDFVAMGQTLKKLGYVNYLFEGGPTLLKELLSSEVQLQLVLSIVSSGKVVDTNADKPNPRQFLSRVLENENSLELADDFKLGANRITRWVKQAP